MAQPSDERPPAAGAAVRRRPRFGLAALLAIVALVAALCGVMTPFQRAERVRLAAADGDHGSVMLPLAVVVVVAAPFLLMLAAVVTSTARRSLARRRAMRLRETSEDDAF